jgi:hypothetical protein
MSPASALVAEVEPLTHTDRMRRVVDVGRRAAGGEADAGLGLRALAESPDAFERLLALTSVFGSRDGELVVRGLSDVSRTVRRKAARMLGLVCDDVQARRALDAIVERRTLRAVVASLARRGRVELVDDFLVARMRLGRDPAVIDLLPFGSEKTLRTFAREVEEGADFALWRRLGRRHAALVAEWFGERLKATSPLDLRWRHRLFPQLPELAQREPDRTLGLVQALFDAREEPYDLTATLQSLVRSRPREAFDLVRTRHESGRPTRPPGAFGALRFDAVARWLGAERLAYLVRHAWSTLGDGRSGPRWFLRLSPDDRRGVIRAFVQDGRGSWGAFLFRHVAAGSAEEVAVREQAFERWSRAAQSPDGTIAPEVLDWLPRDLREREARRHLEACPALASNPQRRLPYARLLPFAEAREVLASFLGHPEGEERAKALRSLVASVQHDGAAMADVLATIKARRFEQDPVRLAMVDALGSLPRARFGLGHLEAVSGVLQDALDAADLSHATSAAAERLVVRLFRLDGFWGARWLTKLLAVRGSVSTWGLGDGLSAADAERLSPALESLATTWTTQERAGAVALLAQSLGVRLGAVAPLLDALERLARELPFVGTASVALDLIRRHDRPRFARLVPELVALDRSFILVACVARYVSLRRQDLLDGFLATAPMTGRFASGRTHWVVDFEVGHARWTARQQRAYASSLAALLRDESRDVPALRFALAALVRLAFADAATVLPFAADPRPPVREMAIRGLPWLDARQGVPTLIEALGDDRARWAIYALRKAFSELCREQVLAELRAVPTRKVTVAKEVVRLLGELGGEEAYRDLLALDRPETHRDVRVALLRALWDHLEKPETWSIFERAVGDRDWVVASKLADVPLGRLSAGAEERVVALLATILGRPEPEARLDLLQRASDLPLRDTNRSLFRRLLAHMGAAAPEEATLALSAALRRMHSGEESTVSRRLCELATRPRLLVAFLPVVASYVGPYASPMHGRVADDLLTALRANPWTAPHYLSLGARRWDWRQLADALVDLARRDLLHHDGTEAALAAVQACVHPALLEEALRRQSDPRLRRIALAALVRAASPQDGWTEPRRALLREYQSDRAPTVAGPANFVFPP